MYTLDSPSILKLRGLIGTRVDQLVWDFNAVYIVRPRETIKIGVTCVTIESPTTLEREECHPIEVSICEAHRQFREDGESGFLYWVVATDEFITNIEIIRVAIRFPPWEAVPPLAVGTTVNLVDCGAFIHTSAGVLPVIPTGYMMYGFRHESTGAGPSVSLVSPAEAKAALPDAYELIPIIDEP